MCQNHNVAAPEHGSGHETSCFWSSHVPKCFTTRRHVPPAARPHVATRQRIQEYICCQSESPSAHRRCGRLRVTRTTRKSALPALPVLATAARTKSLLELNDGLAAANLFTRHARCCSGKKSFNGLHDIASSLRVGRWFSRCECYTCSICLSSELSESGKQSHMSTVTVSQVHWSATFSCKSVHCPHNSKVSVAAASYICNCRATHHD